MQSEKKNSTSIAFSWIAFRALFIFISQTKLLKCMKIESKQNDRTDKSKVNTYQCRQEKNNDLHVFKTQIKEVRRCLIDSEISESSVYAFLSSINQ